jgi:hypothetical protein
MAQLTIDQIITLGELSITLSGNYEAQGDLYGKRLAYTSPTTIATITDALKWQAESFPNVTAASATATITIDTLGTLGQNITVKVYIPDYGYEEAIGIYNITSMDTTTTIIATNLTSQLNTNPYYFTATSNGNVITLTAPLYLGSDINGNYPNCVITSGTLTVSTTAFQGGAFEYNNQNLRGVANYLYWICGKFALEGQYIITGAGGGTVVPINPGSTPNPTEFEVTGSSIIPAGDSTVTISTYIGYNLLFVRNGIPQSQIDLGNSYYNWNKVTGQFICYGPAVEGELFQLYPFI